MDPTTNPQPTANPGAGATPSATDDAALAGAVADLTAAANSGAPLEAPAATPGVATGVATGAVAPDTAMPGAVPGASMGAAPVVDATTATTSTVATTAPVAPVEPTPVAPQASSPTAGIDAVTGAALTNPVIGVPETGGMVAGAPTAGIDGLSMTEPIMRPDLPPAPDPVKQELEAPMKASGPVPGSIGSAVSVGNDGVAVDEKGQPIEDKNKFGAKAGGTAANVAFNDPAGQADAEGQKGSKTKKKMSFNFDLKNMNRGVLIVLIIVAAMIIIGLTTVLITQAI